MDIRLLIDQIVRQTTVLIAQLSTQAGVRAPLATIADQVFLELTSEIERQGVGKKVVADMFGMSLRTYQRRVQRVAESVTVRDKTLWEAVLEYLETDGGRTREEVIERFRYDGEENVAAVVNDLVRSGGVYRVGRGERTIYGVTPEADLRKFVAEDGVSALAELLRVQLYRSGPSTADDLAKALRLDDQAVADALDRLVGDGEVRVDADGLAVCEACMIPVGASAGWEAAVFDHYQALAKAVANKLRTIGAESRFHDRVGGATLSFDISEHHPEAEVVLGLLEKVRADLNEVWDRVVALESEQPVPEEEKIKVTFYFGQNVEFLGEDADAQLVRAPESQNGADEGELKS